MGNKEQIAKEIDMLDHQGVELFNNFQDDKASDFTFQYQSWYTKALKVVTTLAPDRLLEFQHYYAPDPKRKNIGYGNYGIQDFLKGVAPSDVIFPKFDCRREALKCFFNQMTVFRAIAQRSSSILSNLETAIYSELEDNEIEVARRLAKVNLRAAGALTGVIIEGHLQRVAGAHGVTISKKNPTIADLNDPLKAASVIDIPTWRKLSYLADVRNLCSHKKDREPTVEEVNELVNGAEWVSKNIN